MNPLKKLKQLRPQPKAPKVNANKLSAAIIAIVVVAEVMLLLVAPLTYYTLLTPKPQANLNLISGTYPLTESQIEKAWPNLPTAQQIVKSGQYAFVDTSGYIIGKNSTANKLYLQTRPNWWDNSSLSWVLQNETQTNLPAGMGDYPNGLIPVVYQIYLQLNSTIWIQVPQNDLDNTSHPPITTPLETSNGFLGTNMPATYGYAATAIISATVVASACCLIYLRHKTKAQPTVPTQGEVGV